MSNELNLQTKKIELDLDGTSLVIETGKMAKQADGSVLVTMGKTQVLVAATSAKKPPEGLDFFPLIVNYEEKHYAAGKIPGGFFKREGKGSNDATLSARVIDRQIRPMFPDGYKNDTQVIATVLAYDGANDPAIAAAIGTGAALHISDIPFNGPTASVRIGKVDGKFRINPSPAEFTESPLDLIVAGTPTAINMVEGGAKFISESEMLDALDFGHQWIKKIGEVVEKLRAEVGKPKREFTPEVPNTEIVSALESGYAKSIRDAFAISNKLERNETLDALKKEAVEKLTSSLPEDEKGDKTKEISTLWKSLLSNIMRDTLLDTGKRMDGRKTTEIRPISTEADVIQMVHGSSLFSRGETQVLAVVTLGSKDDEQMLDNMEGTSYRNYMLHYNFPPYSTGEVRPLRGQSRREIGHGNLAERALLPVMPSREAFPYTVRVVCEVLESNGSSSMGSVCSGSMALMDCGVPIKAPVAGVAMGLIKEGDRVAILSDILGDEDHLGDMDFKVTGTQEGITAIQMDLKISGITRDIFEKALNQARDGRLHILERMNSAISTPRKELKPSAPRIESFQIDKDKIRDVIGSGGKTIRNIIETTGVKIDIDDNGIINISSTDLDAMAKAKEIIRGIVEGPEVGRVYKGTVRRIVDFGAFVEIFPGSDGLLHISEIANERVQNVNDYLKEGEMIEVKVLEVDRTGRIRLSRKVLLEKDA